jgi:hypothetical protein
MKQIILSFSIIVFVLVSSFCIYLYFVKSNSIQANLLKPFISVDITNQISKPDSSFAQDLEEATTASQTIQSFKESFLIKRTLEEAPRISQSSDPRWWVNSGGELLIDKGIARTMQGDSEPGTKWYEAYKRTTSVDTDGGLHPQNIFRLVLRNKWLDYSQQVFAKIIKDNVSDSPQRDDSNGLFLFNRYYDGDNIYYTGLRVDGAVVIKKKYKGAYYTMAYKKILNLPKYNRTDNPSLLPKDTWIGIKSEVKNLENNKVQVDFYTDIGQTGTWKLGISATDDNKSYGGISLIKSGYAGIRTDFMDVQFKNYEITAL